MTKLNTATTPAFNLNAQPKATTKPQHPLKTPAVAPRKAASEDTFVKSVDNPKAEASPVAKTGGWLLPVAGSLVGVGVAIGTFFVGKDLATKEALKVVREKSGQLGDDAEKLGGNIAKALTDAKKSAPVGGSEKPLTEALLDSLMNALPADKQDAHKDVKTLGADAVEALVRAVLTHKGTLETDLTAEKAKVANATNLLKMQLQKKSKAAELEATAVDELVSKQAEIETLPTKATSSGATAATVIPPPNASVVKTHTPTSSEANGVLKELNTLTKGGSLDTENLGAYMGALSSADLVTALKTEAPSPTLLNNVNLFTKEAFRTLGNHLDTIGKRRKGEAPLSGTLANSIHTLQAERKYLEVYYQGIDSFLSERPNMSLETWNDLHEDFPDNVKKMAQVLAGSREEGKLTKETQIVVLEQVMPFLKTEFEVVQKAFEAETNPAS